MPMNEYGEIVRSNNQSSNASNNSSTQSTNNTLSNGNTVDYSFASEVRGRFTLGKKRNFNLITLAIAVPLYAMIGYFATRYFVYEGYDINITTQIGALIGGIVAFIATLIYNNVWAKNYEGFEYLVSLMFTGISAAIIALAIVIVYGVVKLVIEIVKAIFIIIIVFAIFAGLAGG